MIIQADTQVFDILKKFPGIQPSVRTWNCSQREGYNTVLEFLSITEEIVGTWRNHIPHGTWQDVQVMQDTLRKMLATPERTPPERLANSSLVVNESQTEYAIRLIRWETWWEAHDDLCPRWWDCHQHSNPHD